MAVRAVDTRSMHEYTRAIRSTSHGDCGSHRGTHPSCHGHPDQVTGFVTCPGWPGGIDAARLCLPLDFFATGESIAARSDVYR
jgi:hypothetical protein